MGEEQDCTLQQLRDGQAALPKQCSYHTKLPESSLSRREQSLHERPLDLDRLSRIGLPLGSGNTFGKQETVLYLAYGSNLAARTFQGRRGIKPLAATNVVVPEMVMTFELPGIPYTEPCFANSKYRHERHPPTPPSQQAYTTRHGQQNPSYHNPLWSKGLVGVVYEVTTSDYAHIIATEGGGAAYQDVLVDCFLLPKGTSTVPAHPTTGSFRAHTLFSPIYPPGSSPPPGGKHGNPRFSRPDPDYAQPSLRYLELIWDGADEHEFPTEYKNYLHELEPYTITSRRQALGGFVFRMIWMPLLTLLLKLGSRYSNKDGRSPKWLASLLAGAFRAVWLSYDNVFYGIFGDGERTQEPRR